MTTCYLDHAATSWPKPEGVTAAVLRWYRELGVSAERGDGDAQRMVLDIVERVRAQVGALVGVPGRRCAFTSGATESLNLLLRALLRPGARVVTTAAEHASVVRPLVHLREERSLDITVVPCDAHGVVDAGRVIEALEGSPTALLVLAHAGNVTGAVVDVAPIFAAARARGTTTLLDACQTLGTLDCRTGADLVVASAHKALLGPPGLGFVLAAPGIEVPSPKQGGTGSSRALDHQPGGWPACFEAGTPNTPAILGLGAALDWHATHDREASRASALRALDELRGRLAASGTNRIHSPVDGPRIPILSFTASDHDTAEIGAILEMAGIAVRHGFHCAPWVHRALGTEAAGTVRVSPGPFVSTADVLRVAEALGC
ncbi:MAG: aminotransferase class V-fold PLP-dependent enzyme [Planctomycetota bacterium]